MDQHSSRIDHPQTPPAQPGGRRPLLMALQLSTLGLALAAMLLLPGCGPRMARHMAGAALVGAAVAGTAAVAVAHAHHHVHHAHCGHHRHWREGRWVYYDHGHWEYYDPHSRTWYRYR